MVGRLTADPVLKYSPQGKAVVSFTLAVDRISEGTDYFDVIGFEKLAEISSKYLKKGRLIMVEGRLQTRVFERNDGTKAKVFEIIMENMKMLDKKSDSMDREGRYDVKESKGESDKESKLESKGLSTDSKVSVKESKYTKPYEEEDYLEEDFSFEEFEEEDSFSIPSKSSHYSKDIKESKRVPLESKGEGKTDFKSTDFKSQDFSSKKRTKPFDEDLDFDELFFDDK